MLRRIILLMFVLLSFHTCAYAISAQSAILIDGNTGRIIFEKNAYEKRGMASTTKIMTGILAIENSSPDKIATVSYKAASTEGSSMYLNSGEKIKMESLVYGLMLNSGNDAATAIAENISGSVEAFAELMNDKAQTIDMKDSSFSNPHGLDDAEHYSTAYDMAMLTKYAMKNESFRKIVSTKRKNVELNGVENSRFLTNHNKLLSMYDHCIGVKTGFTKSCGRCLVSAAENDGVMLIAVTLNAPDDWNDHIAMYENAFSNYKSYNIIGKNSYICSLNLVGTQEKNLKLYSKEKITLSLKEDEYQKISLKYEYPDYIEAPVYKGQTLGKIKVMMENQEIAQTELITNYGVERIIKNRYGEKLKYLYTNLLSMFFKSV